MRDVLIVGGGPVGLFLGTLLAEAGLDVVIWEKRATPPNSSRAIGIHAPALHAFDTAGVGDAITTAGVHVRRGLATSQGRLLGEVSFASVSAQHPYVATLHQARTEAILTERLHDVGPGTLVRGVRLRDLRWARDSRAFRAVGYRGAEGSPAPDDDGCASVPGPSSPEDALGEVTEERARFVVGADGARSTVRHLLRIGATVQEYRDTYVMGDFADSTGSGDDAVVYLEPAGVVESFPLPGRQRRLVVRTNRLVPAARAEHLAEVVAQRTGVHLEPGTNTMMSSFGVRRRLARAMVRGHGVLIGDAAHEISPIGGQGMNLGWLDAAALAPLLIAAAAQQRIDHAGFEQFERKRMLSARRAANQAEANMLLGRPASGLRLAARDAALRAILVSPLRAPLAAAYAMRNR